MEKQILLISFISLVTISIISQNASASILSASTKNPPQATADLLTLNNTSGTHLWWVNSNGKMFAASNADFHSSSTVFDSSGIIIRNPASTFAYTLTGGAIIANRTLNIPVITGTDTLATLGLTQIFTGAITDTVTGVGFTSSPASGNAVIDILSPSGSGDAKLDLVTTGTDTWVINGSRADRSLGFGLFNAPAIKAMISSPYLKFTEGTTGGSATTFGSNCPAITCTSPYTWIKARSADGSTIYIPAFK